VAPALEPSFASSPSDHHGSQNAGAAPGGAAPGGAATVSPTAGGSEAAGVGGFEGLLADWQARMESALAARLPAATARPARLHAAMRYSVLGGGKRMRPALTFATARTLGLREEDVEAAACAVEFIHVYSLVHDDLPALDDDALRRGRPTCHKAFDEATAILAGDALQPLAFLVLADDSQLPADPSIRLRLIDLLAHASGSGGMVGGQAIDLSVQGKTLEIDDVEALHSLKTGALIRASVLMAAECVPTLDPALYAALATFAAAIGLAFQIQDDVLDVTGDAAMLGKAVGADRERALPTHPAILGIPASRERVETLHAQAVRALAPFGERAAPLRSLAAWLLSRRH
jgi:farnesyl diphosphate synthase